MAVALRLLAASASFEVATGLALLIVPHTVTQLLLGNPLSGAGIPVGHVAGMGLLCLGIACWPFAKVSRDVNSWSCSHGYLQSTGGGLSAVPRVIGKCCRSIVVARNGPSFRYRNCTRSHMAASLDGMNAMRGADPVKVFY